MGPLPKKEQFETTVFNRISNSVKKTVEAYFVKPLYYIFYSSLWITLIALAVGRTLSWQYFVLVGVLAGTQLYAHFYGRTKAN